MWVMNKHAKKQLKLKSGGWDLSPEIKIKALYMPKIKFAEHHIHHFERAKEPSKQQIFKTGWGHLMYIFHLWLELCMSWSFVKRYTYHVMFLLGVHVIYKRLGS